MLCAAATREATKEATAVPGFLALHTLARDSANDAAVGSSTSSGVTSSASTSMAEPHGSSTLFERASATANTSAKHVASFGGDCDRGDVIVSVISVAFLTMRLTTPVEFLGENLCAESMDIGVVLTLRLSRLASKVGGSNECSDRRT